MGRLERGASKIYPSTIRGPRKINRALRARGSSLPPPPRQAGGPEYAIKRRVSSPVDGHQRRHLELGGGNSDNVLLLVGNGHEVRYVCSKYQSLGQALSKAYRSPVVIREKHRSRAQERTKQSYAGLRVLDIALTTTSHTIRPRCVEDRPQYPGDWKLGRVMMC